MTEIQSRARIDKWLWAVRVFKTRTLASEACRGGHVQISGHPVKPSHEVRLGEVIAARVGPLQKTVKVLGILEQRVGAEAAKTYAEDLTPPEEHQKARAEMVRPLFFRPKGTGRPTKKERRDLDKLI